MSVDAPDVLPRLVLVAWLTEGLGVVPFVFAAERTRYDVIDLNGWRDQSSCLAMPTQGFGCNAPVP